MSHTNKWWRTQFLSNRGVENQGLTLVQTQKLSRLRHKSWPAGRFETHGLSTCRILHHMPPDLKSADQPASPLGPWCYASFARRPPCRGATASRDNRRACRRYQIAISSLGGSAATRSTGTWPTPLRDLASRCSSSISRLDSFVYRRCASATGPTLSNCFNTSDELANDRLMAWSRSCPVAIRLAASANRLARSGLSS